MQQQAGEVEEVSRSEGSQHGNFLRVNDGKCQLKALVNFWPEMGHEKECLGIQQ